MSEEHHGARPWSRQALEEGGFVGFVPVAALPQHDVPAAPGVYVVVRQGGEPAFAEHSPAGRVKGKDPSVAVDVLRKRWLDEPEVLYIGRATLGSVGPRALQKRVDELRRFAAGEPVDHWSGRYVWQLADAADLLVAWNATHEDAAAVGSRMLADFADRYGTLPFGNLRR